MAEENSFGTPSKAEVERLREERDTMQRAAQALLNKRDAEWARRYQEFDEENARLRRVVEEARYNVPRGSELAKALAALDEVEKP